MSKSNFKKYRGLFISTAAFAVSFLVYLVLNYFIQSSAVDEIEYSHVVEQLHGDIETATSSDAIKPAIKLLQSGGRYITDTGKVYQIDAVQTYLVPMPNNAQQLFSQANKGDLPAVKASMATLFKQVEQKKDRKIKLVNTLQIVAALLTVLLYALVLVQLVLRLSRVEETEVKSKKETEGILNTVSEGLFLLGNDFDIGVEQSSSLREMFKSERDLEGNFFDFIGTYVTQGTVQIAKDYLELLFGDRVKERLVEDLNPLKQVEINILRRDGSYESRYIDFRFKRVMVDGKLSHLLCSLTDVSKEVLLEKELANTKEEQDAQLDLLMSILHIDNKQLVSFFESAEKTLNDINNTLENKGNQALESNSHGSHAIRGKLTEIARYVHQLKGDAAALGLNKFEFTAHDFEDEIGKIQANREALTGKDLLPALTRLRELFAELANMRTLVNKFSGISAQTQTMSAVEPLPAESNVVSLVSEPELKDLEADALLSEAVEEAPEKLEQDVAEAETEALTEALGKRDGLSHLARTVAERNNKQIHFDGEGVLDAAPEYLAESLHSIAVQLVRNSIVHGAEAPEEREASGKPPCVNITASFEELGDTYQFLVRDDGRGIDEQQIIEKAKNMGIISPQVADRLDAKKAIGLLFKSGFSSKDDADLDGGRGVGLDIVRELVVANNGRISVNYKKGEFCQFKLTFKKAA